MALTKPFAENGDKKTIPENTTGDGSLSYETGFGGFYALPPEEGGLYIDRAQFNQLMYDTTSQVLENKQALSGLSSSVFSKDEVNNLLNSKIDSSKATKILTENLVKTVGASGADFANLRQALEWASQYSYSGGRFTITLNCNADMPIPGTYLPLCEAEIIIDGQNNSYNCNNNYFMAAVGNYSGNIIIQNFILNYNNITSTAYGAAFQFSSANYVLINVTININNSSLSSLIVSQRGWLHIRDLTINFVGNTTISFAVIRGSYSSIICGENNNFNIDVSRLTGSITHLFNLRSGQSELIGNSPYPTNKITSQVTITNGAIVSIGSNFTDSKLSVAPNTVTSRGIIFK